MTEIAEATRRVDAVCIVGLGVMGRQVAWACVANGLRTIVYDREPAAALAAAEQISQWLCEPGGFQAQAGSLEVADDLVHAVRNADMVFENIYEDVALKRDLYRRIEDIAGGEKLIGSNASAIAWSALSAEMRWPRRFFLMNFTGPRSSRLAEYMDGPATARSVRAAALDWARRIGIVPVPVRKDIPGYVQNRIWRAIKKEALHLVDQGNSTPDDVDRGFILSYGVQFGPFALMDRVGLHSILRVEERYYEATQDPSDRPPKLLVDLVNSGRLGVISNAGFYDYPNPRFQREGWLEGR